MTRLFLALALTMAAPVHAQSWSSEGFDDGVWFIGWAVSPGSELILACGGRSALDRPFEESNVIEPTLTEVDRINVAIDPAPFGWPPVEELHGIAISIDGARYVLPPLPYSDFDGAYAVQVDIGDPVFAALRAGSRAQITFGGDPVASVGLRGSSDAIRVMAQACVAGWASQPVEAPAAAPTEVQALSPPPADWTAASITATAEGFCGGPAQVDLEFTTVEDLDSDGITDLLLNMGDVECVGQEWPYSRGAGLCGASQCSSFVYLSRSGSDEPEEILSLGIWAMTDDSGRRLIAGGAGLVTCASEGFDSCAYRFDPSSGRLEFLGLFPN